jgi:hypothetical protein
MCTPDGGFCSFGGQCCTGVCSNGICGKPCTADGGFCTSGAQCCGGTCSGGVCSGVGPCSHDLCTTGPALNFGCDACVASICQFDQFCCNVEWDLFCVDEVSSICGQSTCTACTPDGGACSFPDECCTGVCSNGVCGSQPMCTSDGTPCGDCLANNCCDQLTTCFNDPSCLQDVGCFINCVTNGGGPPQCLFQCVKDPAALQLLFCLGGQCGPGICF